MEFLKRTWAEIDLDKVGRNFDKIKSCIKNGAKICCVIKADAYGHGAPVLAREYDKLGADWFAVSNIDEAIQIRHSGITEKPILILGYTPAHMAEKLSEYNIAQAVFSISYANELSKYAIAANTKVKIHIKIDTGMSRIGFFYQTPDRQSNALDEIEAVTHFEGLIPEGIFTHFAVSDCGEDGKNFTYHQATCFQSAISELERRGVHFNVRHCANSAAVLDYPEFHFDMVRPGIILYGLSPSSDVIEDAKLEPVMSLKTVISMIKQAEPGITVSYGRTYTANGPIKIATVPIGYADGYPRHFSNRAYMLVHGKKAPVIGRVCMDQLMLDISDIPEAHEGDTVTVFGKNGPLSLSVDELAEYNDTINYELVCLVGKRVPHIYLRDGKIVETLNYICNEQ